MNNPQNSQADVTAHESPQLLINRQGYTWVHSVHRQNEASSALTNQQQSIEEWKPFPGLEHQLEISNKGAVRTKSTHKPVRTYQNKGFDVLMSRVKVDGKFVRPSIHRAVALAFVPNPNNYLWAVAIDQDQPLTLASNLQWVRKQFQDRKAVKSTESLSFKKIRYATPAQAINADYGDYLINRLYSESRLSAVEAKRAGIITAQDDSMQPAIAEGTQFIATPVSQSNYAGLVGKLVAVVVKAKRFAYYLGRVVSITDEEVRVSRDNAEWSERIESRSVIASIARVVSVVEVAVN